MNRLPMIGKTVALGLFALLVFPAFAKPKNQSPKAVELTREGQKWAEKTLRKMSVEEKVGQIFMMRANAGFLNRDSSDYRSLHEAIRQHHIGSVIMSVPFDFPFLEKTGPYEVAEFLNHLQRDSRLPLLIAADFERGITTRITAGTEFPHAMAFGAAGKTAYAEAFGRITAQEARAIGVQWNFFPDTDVNSNPANPIINIRSFGSDPKQVGDLAAAYIRGARANGMLTTAKHFPGHGDTSTDSHLGVAQVAGDLERLRSVELAPFRKAIAAQVDAVMVAHVTVPALESAPDRVATTSAAVVTGLLQREMKFHGVVVTDALDMAGVTRLYAGNIGRAALEAFLAGADLLLMPADLDASYRAVLNAVRKGEISSARLDASVLKVLKMKASVGLDRARLVDLGALPTLVGRPENLELARHVAEDAITLVRDNGKVLPLRKGGTPTAGLPYQNMAEVSNQTVVVVFSDDVRSEAGRTFVREFRRRIPEARVDSVDAQIAAGISDELLARVDQAQAVIIAVEVAPTAGKAERTDAGLRNSVALPEASGALFERILDRAAARTIVVALGNPYLASEFPAIETYLCAFSNASVSEASIVKALFGEIPIRGHLPVGIPAVAEPGAGLERPARAH
jgi:beta-N-acetylhexosaminidase